MKINIIAANQRLEINAREDKSILYQGLESGNGLQYECATGTCGTCKATLIEGEVKNNWPQASGNKYIDENNNEILMCQNSPCSNILTVKVSESIQPIQSGTPIPKFYKGNLVNIEYLNRDVAQFYIHLDETIEFDAGQYIVFKVPSVDGYRAYSMVNYDVSTKILRFVIKKKEGGKISEFIFNQENEFIENVEIFGPLGKAVFYPELRKNIVCIAGGTGIAGMMSILNHASDSNYLSKYKANVIFGVRSYEDSFYLSELDELSRQYESNLNITVTFSDKNAGATYAAKYPGLNFTNGMMHDVVEQIDATQFDNAKIYIAGPPVAVTASIRVLLVSKRVETNNILYDKFS